MGQEEFGGIGESSYALGTKRKRKEANEEGPLKEIGKWISRRSPEYLAYKARINGELKHLKKWERSDEDLLMTCSEYLTARITKEDAIKELPILRDYLKKKHLRQVFDIDIRPKIGVEVPGIFPISRTEKQLQKYKDLAELALESYNKENEKTSYEVIKVVKVNVCPGSHDYYYLTFTAKDVSPRGRYRSPKTFQANVVVPAYQPEIPAEAKRCRIKPKY